MFKIIKNITLSSIIILFFALCLFAKENRLNGIRFIGLKNVKAKTVKSEIKSKVKKPYLEEKVKSDIKALMELGCFDDVEVSIDTNTWNLAFFFKERPKISEINFKGNKKLSKGKLKDEMA
ncbi:MAG: hypothetical protein NT145_01465, partial [Elusimicrobia bacterium]|nr:hypothetical protein [Elusimicrobiota bacterium]